VRDAFLAFLMALAAAILAGYGWFARDFMSRHELNADEVAGIVIIGLIALAEAAAILVVVGHAVGVTIPDVGGKG
jgi:hypothetical protein